MLTRPIYSLLKSYTEELYFLVKYQNAISEVYPVLMGGGVLQGHVLDTTLYLLYTADFPLADKTKVASILTSYRDETTVSDRLRHPSNIVDAIQKTIIKVLSKCVPSSLVKTFKRSELRDRLVKC